ncbi:hypothetical protein ACWC6I_41050 [Streptomyces sp. NPDC001414]
MALKGGVEIGVLSKEPCLVGSLLADQRHAWPAVFGDDLLEPGGVVGVDPTHLASVVVSGWEAARRLVFFGRTVELGGKVVHREWFSSSMPEGK